MILVQFQLTGYCDIRVEVKVIRLSRPLCVVCIHLGGVGEVEGNAPSFVFKICNTP